MKFIIVNKGKGTYNLSNPITKDNLLRLDSDTQALSWDNITGKPSVFPPEAHTHNYENPLTFVGTGATSVSRSGNTVTIHSTDNTGTGGDGNNYPTSLDFNTSTGIFTINRNGTTALTQDLDGRYLTSLPSHNHDDRYYTETEVNNLLAGKSDNHSHPYDNYGSWNLGANGSYTGISSGENVNFVGGGATTVSRSGNTITISSTDNAGGTADGNTYVNAIEFSTVDYILDITRNDGVNLATVPLSEAFVPKSGGTFTGNITAPKFYQSSLRELKTNIETYKQDALSLIGDLDVVEFDYKEGETNNIGVIADDTAPEFLSNEGNAVNLYNTIFIQARAIQQLKEKLESQEERISRLEKLIK